MCPGEQAQASLSEAIKRCPRLHGARAVLDIREYGLALTTARNKAAGDGHLPGGLVARLQPIANRTGVCDGPPAREPGRERVDTRGSQLVRLLTAVGDEAVNAAIGAPGRRPAQGVGGRAQSSASIFTT